MEYNAEEPTLKSTHDNLKVLSNPDCPMILSSAFSQTAAQPEFSNTGMKLPMKGSIIALHPQVENVH